MLIGILLTSWLSSGSEIDSVAFFGTLAISLVISSAISLGYFHLIETIAEFTEDQTTSLRLAILVEVIALPIALAGLLFRIDILVHAAFLLLIGQIFVPLTRQFIQLPESQISKETETKRESWTGLGKLADIITVGSFIANIAVLAAGYL